MTTRLYQYLLLTTVCPNMFFRTFLKRPRKYLQKKNNDYIYVIPLNMQEMLYYYYYFIININVKWNNEVLRSIKQRKLITIFKNDWMLAKPFLFSSNIMSNQTYLYTAAWILYRINKNILRNGKLPCFPRRPGRLMQNVFERLAFVKFVLDGE